jgi:outer membrane protein assembly factor BamB
MLRSALAAIALTFLMLTAGDAADQWPRFRGLHAGLVADDALLPDSWSETENVVWKVTIPGIGWSSPVVWDDHVIVTAAISAGQERPPIPGLYDPGDDNGSLKSTAEHRWIVYDVDFKTGAIRWQRELLRMAPAIPRHIKNTYASETPVTDGERVYVYLASIGVLAALDLNGRTIWTKEVGTFSGSSDFGTASSPALHNDRLYLVNDNATQSFIAAYDKQTGNEVWKVNRDERQGWATPFIW